MPLTPTDLCTNALRRIGAIAEGEQPSPALLADTFTRLNTMIDLWGTQRLTINGIEKFSRAAIQGHNPYTIGAGGDFNQVRPIWLSVVTVTIPGTIPTDIPVTIIDAQTYAVMIAAKTTQSQISQYAYYDQAFPLGNLNLWPVLNDATITLNIWVPVAIVQFTSLTQTITLLPGYQSALEYNLAKEMIPELGRPIDPATGQLVLAQATETLGWIKRANSTPILVQCDPGLLTPGQIVGGGNWYTGP